MDYLGDKQFNLRECMEVHKCTSVSQVMLEMYVCDLMFYADTWQDRKQISGHSKATQ